VTDTARQPYRCSRCHQPGHQARHCGPRPPAPVEVGPGVREAVQALGEVARSKSALVAAVRAHLATLRCEEGNRDGSDCTALATRESNGWRYCDEHGPRVEFTDPVPWAETAQALARRVEEGEP